MERWTGRVALVTGAGSGIGQAIARDLFKSGMRVLAADILLDRVKRLELEGKGKIHGIKCDVTNEEDVRQTVKWARDNLGGIDVVVNSAGMCFLAGLTSIESEKLRKMLDTNVFGLTLVTREVIKDMRDRKVDDGHVVHISSVAGQRIPDVKGMHFYSATKHAVKVLTEGLRRELRDLGTKIRVTGISPGIVHTNLMAADGWTPEMMAAQVATSPYLDPEDVANTVHFAIAAPPHVQIHEITVQPLPRKK